MMPVKQSFQFFAVRLWCAVGTVLGKVFDLYMGSSESHRLCWSVCADVLHFHQKCTELTPPLLLAGTGSTPRWTDGRWSGGCMDGWMLETSGWMGRW